MKLVEVSVVGEQFDAIELIRKKVNFECKDEPLYICNVSDIINKYKIWTKYMPRVLPFYGMVYSLVSRRKQESKLIFAIDCCSRKMQ